MKQKIYLSIKLVSVIFFLSIFSDTIYSQNAGSSSSIVPEAYDRLSLSLMMSYSIYDPKLDDVKEGFSQVTLSDKFFINEIEDKYLEIRERRNQGSSLDREDIEQKIEDLKISNQIIAYWYKRQRDGKMDMERVHSRGLMNATDADVLINEMEKRGLYELMDYGNRLISKSYVVILDITEIEETENDYGGGIQISADFYLYKIDFTESEKMQVYDAWISESDDDAEKRRKNELFASVNPGFDLVHKESIYSLSSSNSAYKKLTRKQHINELMQDAADRAIFKIEKEVPEFKVISALYSSRPLTAKIGKHEGLNVDDRYFVYEHKYNPKTNKIKEVRRGAIRADSKIADNRSMATGESETSEFYQISGQRLREGYVIQQNNDWGIGLTIGQNFGGEMAGFNIGGDYSIGRYAGVPSFYVVGNVAFETKNTYGNVPVINASPMEDISFFRFDVGLMKGYHFMRNFELNPYIAYGQESANISGDDDLSVYTHLIKTGGYLSINLTYFFELIGGVNLNVPFGNAYKKEGDEDGVEQDVKYTDLFANRSGASFYTGIRVRF